AASVSVRVQFRLASVQVHPVPAILVAVSPVGNVSVTLTCPLVGLPPMFPTVNLYCAPICPVVKDPVCVFATVTSAGGGGLPAAARNAATAAPHRSLVKRVAVAAIGPAVVCCRSSTRSFVFGA